MNDIGKGRPGAAEQSADRRRVLRQVGRFAAVTAPSVVLLLAAGSKPSQAQSKISLPIHPPVSSRQFKDRGGAIDPRLALAIVAAGVPGHDATDKIGLCLAAVQGLTRRIGDLEERLAAG